MVLLTELHEFLDNILVHIHFRDNRITDPDNLIPAFLQYGKDWGEVRALGDRSCEITVVIEDSEPGSHAIWDRQHIFRIDFVVFQFSDNILPEGRFVYDTEEGRAELQIGDIFHHVPADSPMNIFDMSDISSIRDVDIFRKAFDVDEDSAGYDDAIFIFCHSNVTFPLFFCICVVIFYKFFTWMSIKFPDVFQNTVPERLLFRPL